MIKEIHEAPEVLLRTARQDESEMRKLARATRSARHVYCIGSGTAGAAAAQIAYYLRTIGGIHATALIGAEASDYYGLFKKGDLMIAPSQSGETADVLEVLEIAKKRGVRIASHVNMPGSYMTRISDFPFMAQAGPEICVMSTKIFVAQIAWGYLLAQAIAGEYARGKRELMAAARAARGILADTGYRTSVMQLAEVYAREEHLFLLAKGQNLQIMKEAMVKIIEGSYVHAHGIPAGDLKHYAITLMEEGTPVVAVTSDDELAKDIENAVHEVRARGAAVSVVGNRGIGDLLHIAVPGTRGTGAILNIVALQLLAYYMAVERGNNVDKPRNIAKSVTVK
jgi:glucosamine--fructose-6-phosphate aminotransferase (isomerizing)